MPKWGIDMTEGTVVRWLVSKGEQVAPGMEIVEIESEKAASAVEAANHGLLRRQIAAEGQRLAVGALLGVIADNAISDADIDKFTSGFEMPEVIGESAPSPDKTLEVSGQTIGYLESGEGKPAVLLVHGFGGNLKSWAPVQLALSRAFRTVSMDLPGHGGSVKAIASGEADYFVGVIAEFIRTLELAPVHLVGHSWGGDLAVLVAEDQPDLVASLTLIGAQGPGEAVDKGYVQAFIEAARRKALKAVLQQLFHDPALVTRKMVEDTLKYKRLDAVEETLRKIAAAARQSSAGAKPVPRLLQIIAGKSDSICPFDTDVPLPEGVEIHLLEKVGHMPQVEAPAEVVRIITDFARAHPEVS